MEELAGKRKKWLAGLIERIQGDRSNEELGKVFGVTKTAVSDWKNEKLDPKNASLERWNQWAGEARVSLPDLIAECDRYCGLEEPTAKKLDPVAAVRASPDRAPETLEAIALLMRQMSSRKPAEIPARRGREGTRLANHPEFWASFAEAVQGRTLEELSNAFGLDATTIQEFLGRSAIPSLDQLIRIWGVPGITYKDGSGKPYSYEEFSALVLENGDVGSQIIPDPTDPGGGGCEGGDRPDHHQMCR